MTDYKYWNKMGLDDYFHPFALVLENNIIIPHQVLLEASIDDFAHRDRLALTEAATKFPMSDTENSTDDSFQ